MGTQTAGSVSSFTSFNGLARIATGALGEVVRKTKAVLERDPRARILIFDDRTGEPVEIDFRGTPAQVLSRLAPPGGAPAGETENRGPGRPKLGVVAREVTLLPRHWEWLASQPGGASVALRKLVEHASKANREKDRVRLAREAAYRFMSAMAGNEPNYEEALRSLFNGDAKRFQAMIRRWPADVRTHARKLAAAAFREAPA